MKKLNKNQMRQGDVWIERIDTIPDMAKPKEGPVILAYGEVTGHCHEIKDAAGVDVLEMPDGSLILDIQSTCNLTHQEHDTISLEPGIYVSFVQKEYSPQKINNVQD